MRLLLIEDDRMIGDGLRQALRLEGHAVDWVYDAQAATATLASELRKSVETRSRELAGRDADFFSGVITRFDGQRVTRLEMLQFVKEHELTHRAQTRDCYARGALQAAKFLADRPPGRYHMEDVLGLSSGPAEESTR